MKKIKMFMKKYAVIIVSIVVIVIAGIYYAGTVGGNTAMVTDYGSQLSKLKSELSVKKAAHQKEVEQVQQELIGLDPTRYDRDLRQAKNLMTTVTTWNSLESYREARNEVKEKYKIDDESEFLRVFMPGIANKQAPNGKNYNEIDTNGLNVKFDNMHPYVSKISGSEYSYFTIVDMIAKTNDNKGKKEFTAIFTYTVDKDGMIKNLNAIPEDIDKA